MKQILLEQPHFGVVHCPFCGFKFDADGRVELWTPDAQQNKRNFAEIVSVYKKIPLTCLNCGKNIVFNFTDRTTTKFDKEYKRAKPSLKDFLKNTLINIRPQLKMGDSVIPESLTFEKFVNGQTDDAN